MAFAFSSPSLTSSSCFRHCKAFHPKLNRTVAITPFNRLCISENGHTIFRKKACRVFMQTAVNCVEPTYPLNDQNDVSLEFEDDEKVEEECTESPWEGAIIYKRSSATTHIEYCTTLERLGLGKLSTDASKSRASEMGIRVTKSVKDYPFGTPVQVSIDVTKKKKRLRLDGIVKTVIALSCNSCGDPAPESFFSDFSLLLTDEPVEEPDVIDMGVIFGEDKNKSYNDDEDDASIDFEDRLYFPSGEKEIDISKHVRDLVHLEINITAVCSPSCRGYCFECGTNLNRGVCRCSEKEPETAPSGPLRDLKEKMQAM